MLLLLLPPPAGIVGVAQLDTFGDIIPPRTLSPQRDGAFGWVPRQGARGRDVTCGHPSPGKTNAYLWSVPFVWDTKAQITGSSWYFLGKGGGDTCVLSVCLTVCLRLFVCAVSWRQAAANHNIHTTPATRRRASHTHPPHCSLPPPPPKTTQQATRTSAMWRCRPVRSGVVWRAG